MTSYFINGISIVSEWHNKHIERNDEIIDFLQLHLSQNYENYLKLQKRESFFLKKKKDGSF